MQKHELNPSVNRGERPRILTKRIRSIERKAPMGGDKRFGRLDTYRTELATLLRK